MSMLFYTLITAFLIGIQAEPHSESNVPAGHTIPQAHWTKLQHSLDTALRRVRSAPAVAIAARVAGQTRNITVDPRLFKSGDSVHPVCCLALSPHLKLQTLRIWTLRSVVLPPSTGLTGASGHRPTPSSTGASSRCVTVSACGLGIRPPPQTSRARR